MAEPDGREKEYQSNDQVGAAHSTIISEPVAIEPLQYVGSESDLGGGDSTSEGEKEKDLGHEFDQLQTATTNASALTTETRSAIQPPRKPWYKKWNPLRWGKLPPIPKERTVSPEYTAGFLSLLTFQWMQPLMTVCLKTKQCLA